MIGAVLPHDHWLWLGNKDMRNRVKTIATITSFATAILASAYLSYSNPRGWWLTTLSLGVINLYSLPKFLHYGNKTIIQLALVINLSALSCLSLGAMGVISVSLCQLLFTSIRIYDFSSVLMSAFGLTAILGYGIPLFQEALEKSYRLLHDPNLQERLVSVQEQFHYRPEVGLGFLQSDLWQNFVLQLILFKPEWVWGFCQIFNIHLPDYAWSMAVVTSEKMNLDQFDRLLASLESWADTLSKRGEELPDDIKKCHWLHLKFALRSLNATDIPSALNALLLRGGKCIPTVLSNEEFLKLLTEDVLPGIHDVIQTFLELMENWQETHQQHDDLSLEITQFEQEIQNQTLQQLSSNEEDFEQRYQELNQKYSELRIEVEKGYFNKRLWQDFAPLWNHETDLPFKNSQQLLDILHDDTLLKEIDATYFSLLGTGQGANRTLYDRLQYIKNKLATLHEDEEGEEDLSAIMYLAANKGFIKKDYDDLQEWLNLDSPHDLEEAMSDIGLATEEELYEHNILPRQGQISKTEIRNHLRHYIEKAPKLHLADRMQPKEQIDEKSPIQETIEKVTRVLFYAITSGLILVPILINPYAGLIGFATGLCFFILKRFEVSGTQSLADLGNEFLEDLPFGDIVRWLLHRRIFSFNPQRREEANLFVNSDPFARMRMLNWRILGALLISNFHLRFENPFIGSFLQGAACANEVVGLI